MAHKEKPYIVQRDGQIIDRWDNEVLGRVWEVFGQGHWLAVDHHGNQLPGAYLRRWRAADAVFNASRIGLA